MERAAYVDIRQSSLQQVRHNLESGCRQYALQDRARELGFEEVVVVDDDLGISAAITSAVVSTGFWRRCVMAGSAGYWQSS